MSIPIINIQTNPTLTIEQIGKRIANGISGQNTQLLKLIIQSVNQNYQAVWAQEDQVNFNAQAVLNLFGVNAGLLVQNFQGVSALVNSVAAANGLSAPIPTTYPDGQTVTINEDGTVTVHPAA